MRTFIAIELGQEIKTCLHAIQNRLTHIDLDAKWVEPDNLHMTLKFLGEIDDATLLEVKECIETCSQRFQTLQVSLTHFGFFPDDRRPRVFFVATDQETALQQIASCLEERLQNAGFTKEGRFKSHITLARLKSAKNIELLKKALEKLSAQGGFEVNGVTLFKSVLGRAGPVYEVILKVNFKS
jgi:2'-5' RNA ligase